MYIIGLDFGTLSVRAVLVGLESGSVFSTAVDQYKHGVIYEGSGILMRRYDTSRTNDWHPSPGRVYVFTLSGGLEIEVSDGTKRRIGPGDIVIAEDPEGEGHITREIGPEPRVSIYVPLR